MNFTKVIKSHQELALILIVSIMVINIMIWIPFYSIDPHSGDKCQYYRDHKGLMYEGDGYQWNRNLLSGKAQYDIVFWNYFPFVYSLFESSFFLALLTVLGAIGIYFILKTAGYAIWQSMAGLCIYGLSAHFMEFLPIWQNGWQFMHLFIPWQFYFLIRAKEKRSLINLVILSILSAFSFLLFELQISLIIIVIFIIYMIYSFWVMIEYEDGLREYIYYLLSILLVLVLGFMTVAERYIPLLSNRQEWIIPEDSSGIWFYIIIIAVVMILAVKKLWGKTTALLIIVLLVIATNLAVLVNYVPGIERGRGVCSKEMKLNPVMETLVADSTQYRIYPLGREFYNSYWSAHRQSIGGATDGGSERYQEIIENCLPVEIDKNLKINWNVLQMLNVKYVVSKLKIPSVRLEYKDYSYNDQLILYKVKMPQPWCWFVSRLQYLQEDEIPSWINNPEFDVSQTALLENEIEEFAGRKTLPLVRNSRAKLCTVTPETIRVETINDSTGFLVFSELYDDSGNWRCYIDNQAAKLHPVDYILQGVVTPPGEHIVELRFELDDQEYNRRISYAAVMLLIILLLGDVIYILWEKLLS